FLSREDSRARYAEGTEFHIGRIDMVANTGTYVDAPFHRFADGVDLADLELDRLADVPGVVVSADTMAMGPEAFAQLDVAGKAVLVHTGHDRHWRTDAYYENHPFLTEAAAEYLRDANARIVGI